MNLFKKFYLYLCIGLLAVGFASCGDNETDEPTPQPGPDAVQEKTVTLEKSEGMNVELTFNATETWKATSDAEWCTINLPQGTAGNNKKVTVKVEANNTKDARTAHVSVKTISAGKLIANFTLTQPGMEERPSVDTDGNAPSGMDLTAQGLVSKIRVGWNLGNTCEAGIWDGWNDDDLNIETNWISPKVKTSKQMFTTLKDAGFNAIRIPVRWYLHADADLHINDRWMARVKEIVEYAVSQDMYVILNSHHDNWYDRLPVGYNEADIHAKFKTMWTQIATCFKDYDQHLILAGANEIIKLNSDGSENWGNPNDQNLKFVNDLMQLFVNTVRATGGNNEWRCLMVQPWACNPANAVTDKFVLPTDTKENRLIVEYHCYDPYNYATPKTQHEVSQTDYNNIANSFSKLNTKFVARGIPCIMAEFGSTQDNTYSRGKDAADRIRAEYHTFIVKEAKKYGIPGFYWDNYCFETNGENFGLLDRKNCNFPARAQVALKGIMEGLD